MKKFKWVVEFTVAETWVADGFNLTDVRAKKMLARDLAYAYGSELHVKVIKAPSPLRIAKAQGYVNSGIILREIKENKL